MTDPNDGAALTQAVSEVQAALATLQRLGRSDKADALLNEAENAATYDDLKADREHNQDWLRTQYARRYINAMTSLARKLTTAADLAGTQDADDAARVYGIKGLAGDVASLAISRRDAGDRVAEITDTTKRQALLAQAIRTGDDVLAHAIAEAAITSGDEATADQFAAAYPHLSDAVDRLWAAEHRRMSSLDITVAWRVGALKPAQISSLQPYEIQAAASGQTGVGSRNVGR